jgi:thiamine monophosphate kinase
VVKADPITFATEAIGWYAVQINANDIATTGAAPRWMLAILLLPEGRTDRALVEEIFGQLRAACEALGITLIGGPQRGDLWAGPADPRRFHAGGGGGGAPDHAAGGAGRAIG